MWQEVVQALEKWLRSQQGAAEDGDRRVEDEQMNNKACESRTEEVSMTAVKVYKQIGGATNSMWTWYSSLGTVAVYVHWFTHLTHTKT